MQLKRGKADYEMPKDFGALSTVALDGRYAGGHYMQIMQITTVEMQRLRLGESGLLGVPYLCAVMEGRLWFHPTPDADYVCIARYHPAPKEI